MELNLVKIINKKTKRVMYFGVNDRHYDGMLATGGSNLDDLHEWNWLGDVTISEKILNEQGYFWLDKSPQEGIIGIDGTALAKIDTQGD